MWPALCSACSRDPGLGAVILTSSTVSLSTVIHPAGLSQSPQLSCAASQRDTKQSRLQRCWASGHRIPSYFSLGSPLLVGEHSPRPLFLCCFLASAVVSCPIPTLRLAASLPVVDAMGDAVLGTCTLRCYLCYIAPPQAHQVG